MSFVKQKRKAILLEYLSNPNNDFPTRAYLSCHVLGYKSTTQINQIFTPDELQEIEFEALAERRRKCARESIRVDRNVVLQAQKSNNPKWAELYYKRFENWVEKKSHEIAGQGGEPLKITVINYADADVELKNGAN